MPRAADRILNRLLERAPALRRTILFIVVLGVPVTFLRFTLDPFNVPKLVLLALGVMTVLALRAVEVLQGRSWRGLELLAVPAAAIALPFILSWVFSPYRGWAVLGLQPRFQGLVPYVFVIVLGVLIADAFREREGELAFALTWAGAIVGGYALMQTLGLDPFTWSLFGAPTESISTTGNPNFTGGFLGIVLPIGAGLALTDPGRRRIVTRLLVFVVAGWLVARSQGGWAAGVAGSAIVVGYALRDRFRLSHLAGWFFAALVAAVTLGVVLIGLVRPDSRFTTEAAVDRSRWVEAAFEMGLASPLVGRGPNSFAIEGVRTRPLEDALEFTFDFADDPHSVPMSMFANLGVLGLAGFLGVLGWSLWFLSRIDEPSLLQIAFVAGVVGYFVQALVSIDELTLRVGLWSALGGLVASRFPAERTSSTASRSRNKRRERLTVKTSRLKAPVATGVVVLVLIASVLWVGSILIADVFARQASMRFSAGDVDDGRAKYAAALMLRDSADYRGRLALNLKDAAVDPEGDVDGELAEAADDVFSFTDDVPYAFSIVSHARFLAEWGASDRSRLDQAADIYLYAIDIDPVNPLIRAEAGVVLGELGRHQEAFDLLVQMREQVTAEAYAPYWGALALEAAELGEKEIAREALQAAISLQGDQPEALEAQKLLGDV